MLVLLLSSQLCVVTHLDYIQSPAISQWLPCSGAGADHFVPLISLFYIFIGSSFPVAEDSTPHLVQVPSLLPAQPPSL